MASRRLSTKYKPYEVVWVKGGAGRRSATNYSESFDDEGSARRKAESLAKKKEIKSVYLRKMNDDGYAESQEQIKIFTEG